MENISELNVIKEFLLIEMDLIIKEIEANSQKSEDAGIPIYIKNMFVTKLEERREFLWQLCKQILFRIEQSKQAQHNATLVMNKLNENGF